MLPLRLKPLRWRGLLHGTAALATTGEGQVSPRISVLHSLHANQLLQSKLVVTNFSGVA